MTHHVNNIDGSALVDITAQLGGDYDQDEPIPDDMPADFYIRPWVTGEADPPWPFESLANIYTTYWERRDRPNVGLFHFADYLRDLPAEVRRLADLLSVDIDDAGVSAVAEASRLGALRDRAVATAPDAQLGAWKDPAGFFRSGQEGEWRQYLSDDEAARYDELLLSLVDADLAGWITNGWGAASGVA
jgi:hypothetical protein